MHQQFHGVQKQFILRFEKWIERAPSLPQSGLKWSERQILPPRYILAVLPSSSGSAISGAVMGYVTGMSNSTSNSYLSSSWTYQHLPNHRVPSLFDSNLVGRAYKGIITSAEDTGSMDHFCPPDQRDRVERKLFLCRHLQSTTI